MLSVLQKSERNHFATRMAVASKTKIYIYIYMILLLHRLDVTIRAVMRIRISPSFTETVVN